QDSSYHLPWVNNRLFPRLKFVFLLVLGRYGWKKLKHKKTETQTIGSNKWRKRLIGTAAFFSALYTLFYFMWGFNYARRPIQEQLQLPSITADADGLTQEFQAATTALITAYQELPISPDHEGPVDEAIFPHNLEQHLRTLLTDTLEAMGYPSPGRVRVRRIFPPGLLMQLGASGIYIPFLGEGHLDAALPPVLWPEVMAHEMAHGYGFGEEGTCNFWAVLVTTGSANPAVRYSGYLAYWIEVARMYRRLSPRAYQIARGRLPAGIRADLAAINQTYKTYPGLFPQFYHWVYDRYLKNQGIKTGIKSYSQVVQLRMGWEEKQSVTVQ
ncbi:MAG: DUF3810 domain-containing protein, partial [Bacteroidota bacterium]